jgi:hypothetical protein
MLGTEPEALETEAHAGRATYFLLPVRRSTEFRERSKPLGIAFALSSTHIYYIR